MLDKIDCIIYTVIKLKNNSEKKYSETIIRKG